jgi:hypothetical protein
MPEGRVERLICLGALIALGFLVALTVPKWQEYSRSQKVEQSRAPTSSVASSTTSSTRSESPVSEAAADQRQEPRSTDAILRLRAERGDCWLLVRRDDEAGQVLFTGVLTRGRSVTIAGTFFWVRMGAGQNITGSFDGREVRDLPGGAATVSIEDGAVSVVELG